MNIVVHRVNSIEKLKSVPVEFGAEIDIRAFGSELVLNHESRQPGEKFADFLGVYAHGLLVLNIKEAGIEDEVLALVREKKLADYFLLDVEFPYIYQASRRGERAIAMRYSEDEAIETVANYADKVDWVWIDTNTKLPLNGESLGVIRKFKSCLVCPERWQRSGDIAAYAAQMRELGFWPDAVMTAGQYAEQWLDLSEN